MCGLVGFIGEPRPEGDLCLIAESMAGQIAHRGPDDSGVYTEPQAGLGFGFRRLSIIDLSPNGHQPMESPTGRYVIMMNGEIYNFAELRSQLPAEVVSQFRGYSDTEVLLGTIDVNGFEAALKATAGMFAIALWDRKEQTLILARDRFGEKPMYYGWNNGTFFFGSQLKSFRGHEDWSPEVDRDSLSLLLRHGYIPDPLSIYKGIYKLSPGSMLTISGSRCAPAGFNPRAAANADGASQPRLYWNLIDVAQSGKAHLFSGSEDEAIDRLDEVLRNAVSSAMVSDRPLGAFLSGGVDSSLIVSLMQACSDEPVKTYTIGFTEQEFNEAEDAKAVAEHLGTEHHELYVSMDDARSVIPLLPKIYDEPFADVSQIPTFLVARMASEKVTVCLTGDGGDELFGGYERYFSTKALWDSISKYSIGTRRSMAKFVGAMPDGLLNAVLTGPRLLEKYRSLNASKVRLASKHALRSSAHDLHCSLVSAWQAPDQVVLSSHEPRTVVNDDSFIPAMDSLYERLMLVDSLSVLPGDMLVKLDRAAMSVGVESRAPFLNQLVASYAWSLPLGMKFQNGSGKWILKKLLYRYVPQAMVDRPKSGFAVPVRHWLRGPLKEWAQDTLSRTKLEREGFFDPHQVQAVLEEHLSGKGNNEHLLWPVLMFESWLERQQGSAAEAPSESPERYNLGSTRLLS